MGLDALFAPCSVAVIGASTDPSRIGGRPIAYMRAQGFQGEILPVNPNRAEVQGLRAYPSIAALPLVPDAAIVALPAPLVEAAIDALGRAGVRATILFSSGFAEVDAQGAAAQARIAAIAGRFGMRLLGPNTLGLFNVRLGWYGIFSASFDSFWPIPGRIGIASQSGAFGTHLFSAARVRGLGVSACITTGNEADVTLGDAIGWLAQDPGTDVIAAAAESLRRPDTLIAALGLARAQKKPVVMLKMGRSALGQSAARSHTAALASDDRVFGAVLAEFGAVRAESAEEMLDIAYAAEARVYPARNALGVLTVSGGGGVLIADGAQTAGLPMPPLPEAAQAKLKRLLPFSSPRNPVDCTAQALNDPALIEAFAETLAAEGGTPSMLAFFSQIGGSPKYAPTLLAALGGVHARYPDRLTVLSAIAPPERVREYEAAGILVFPEPMRALRAIAAMGRFGAAFAAAAEADPPPSLPAIPLPAASPNEAGAKRLLARAGIAAVPERVAKSPEEAASAASALGFPVVLKILSPDIVHKSDVGGVALGVRDASEVRAEYVRLVARIRAARPDARLEGVLVARELKGAIECVIGAFRDPAFGPIMMFGLGGVLVEVLGDIQFHRAPFGEVTARAMIEGIKGAKVLNGVRGQKPRDIAALARMLARLSAFAAGAGERLVSVELNPVLAMADGEGAFAADAVLEIAGS